MVRESARVVPGSSADSAKPLEAQYPREIRRWGTILTVALLAASACVIVAIATPFTWAFGGAVLLGPGGAVAAIIYLAMSTDTVA